MIIVSPVLLILISLYALTNVYEMKYNKKDTDEHTIWNIKRIMGLIVTHLFLCIIYFLQDFFSESLIMIYHDIDGKICWNIFLGNYALVCLIASQQNVFKGHFGIIREIVCVLIGVAIGYFMFRNIGLFTEAIKIFVN